QAGDHAFHRVLEVDLLQPIAIRAARADRRLVGDVLEIRAREAGRVARDHLQVDVLTEWLSAGVDAENFLAAREIRRGDEHLAVETAGPQQRGVQVLEPVRSAHHNDLLARLEAVELDQELVQRLILLAREAGAGALRADGIQLVDEDDRRRVLAGLLEQLPDPSGAEPGEHLDECRRALREEFRARLACDRLREQRLAGARRAVEQNPLRYARPESAEASRVAQEVDDLGQLVLRLVEARDLIPRDR